MTTITPTDRQILHSITTTKMSERIKANLDALLERRSKVIARVIEIREQLKQL